MTSALELKVIFAAVDRFVRPVNNITNSASAAAKALRESQKDAQKLNKVLQNIDGYNRVTDEAAKARKEFEKNSKRIFDLKLPDRAAEVELDGSFTHGSGSLALGGRGELDVNTPRRVADMDVIRPRAMFAR